MLVAGCVACYKINPNTAHKLILQLLGEGLIEVRSVRGTVVSERIPGSALQRVKLLKKEMEQLVVEAKTNSRKG